MLWSEICAPTWKRNLPSLSVTPWPPKKRECVRNLTSVFTVKWRPFETRTTWNSTLNFTSDRTPLRLQLSANSEKSMTDDWTFKKNGFDWNTIRHCNIACARWNLLLAKRWNNNSNTWRARKFLGSKKVTKRCSRSEKTSFAEAFEAGWSNNCASVYVSEKPG